MAATGYSGTPLIKKLGITPEMKVLVIQMPDNYFDLLEQDISGQLIKGKQIPDFIHLFATNIAAFEKGMQKIRPYAKANTTVIIWVSWYKKAAGITTDLNENIIRDFALQNSLVDIKVCAVSALWSGLKLVVPVAKR
ncbi:hypothetical protein [Ferruginibacter sp. SUN106]|uniref:hypothetical protein n=1 Tax=Ferruginibacter sp. SUN106 TaxID=2978348 RepID=UPI003D36BF86